MRLFCAFAVLALSFLAAAAQEAPAQVESQERSELDGLPVLVKHLPDWESRRDTIVFSTDLPRIQAALGSRAVFEDLEFMPGTEAVTAQYPEGKLLIVEYPTPQASADADLKINDRLAQSGPDASTVYRRIGNYNAFVFDVSDAAAGNVLLDQVKYEKVVQWLGEDPGLLQRAERAFINTTSDLFVSTLFVIVLGMGGSVVAGLCVGILFFVARDHRRAGMEAFSDAGGMVRLNLDHLTPEIVPERLLKD